MPSMIFFDFGVAQIRNPDPNLDHSPSSPVGLRKRQFLFSSEGYIAFSEMNDDRKYGLVSVWQKKLLVPRQSDWLTPLSVILNNVPETLLIVNNNQIM